MNNFEDLYSAFIQPNIIYSIFIWILCKCDCILAWIVRIAYRECVFFSLPTIKLSHFIHKEIVAISIGGSTLHYTLYAALDGICTRVKPIHTHWQYVIAYATWYFERRPRFTETLDSLPQALENRHSENVLVSIRSNR